LRAAAVPEPGFAAESDVRLASFAAESDVRLASFAAESDVRLASFAEELAGLSATLPITTHYAHALA
jgi:hypothetical protein